MSGDGTNVLYAQDVTGTLVEGWQEIVLDEAVPFDNTENLWIGMYAERPGGSFNEPTSSVDVVYTDRYDYFAYNGAAWTQIGTEYGITDQAWMLRGFVSTNPAGKSVALGTGDYKTTDKKDFSNAPRVSTGLGMIKAEFAGQPFPVYAQTGDKDLMGYNVYRGSCYSEDDFEFLGYTLDDQFTDNNWGDVDWGVYRWAVEAVYTNNVSERAYSNCLDKDMETVVGVEVTTNSGDAPEGCMVLFTNTSELDLDLTYELELDASGLGSVDPFRKGVYDIMVTLPGFGDIMETGVLVDSDTTFVWQLEELLAPPSDLYVTPTGFATWSGGGAIPFEPYMTNFDDGIPEGWEIIVGGSSSDTWQWVTSDAGNTLDGTPFMFIDSDGAGSSVFMDEYLVSPVIDASNADELYVMFDQYFNTGYDPSAYGAIDVYDGSNWVTVLNQTADAGAYGAPDHQMIDVSEYANADFRVRFHYSATWDYWWAGDNVMVHDNSGKYADGKAFQFFKIWHDGVFSNDVDTNFYQYGTNPDVDILVPGETYLAEVASLYSTGLSAKSEYEWTYLPCDSFPSWTIFEAYNVEGSDDKLVVWTDNVVGGTPIEGRF